jgi:hypothetical protein
VAKESLLIFPGGMPRSLGRLELALADGQRVVGASSLRHDPARARFPEWTYLPYVTAPDFDEALRRVIAEKDIGGVYTPNPVVWDYLSRCIAQLSPGVALVNASPVMSEVAPFHKALQFGESVVAEPLQVGAMDLAKPSVSALELAALFRHTESIPGMCDHEKTRALCELFRHAPAGDVVEIGSWWGKSAFVLARLAQCYGTGPLLCVDPWSNEHLIQNDEKGLVDRVPVNADEALQMFQMNLLPYAKGDVNYLRLPSVDAARKYRHNAVVETPVFGQTRYGGRIAVLHVDGNHSYESVSADVDAWADLMVPNGWIIIDDYNWPYGDGPQRVGDEFLSAWDARIRNSFVTGGALFIHLSD